MTEPHVLLATCIGPGKEYCFRFLSQTMKRLEATSDFLVVSDGVELPEKIRKAATCLTLPTISRKSARWYDTPTARIARPREAIRKWFLGRPEFTHCFMLDSDTIAPPDTIPRLFAHGVPMATAIYSLRTANHVALPTSMDGTCHGIPAGVRSLEDLARSSAHPGCFEAAHFGMGAMLIRREVLESTEWRDPAWLLAEGQSEDIQFCRDATANGFGRVLIDPSLSCWHVAETGCGNRVRVLDAGVSAMWTDVSCARVANRFGEWRLGESRALTAAQAAELGAGFEIRRRTALELEVAPIDEILHTMETEN